MSHLLVTEIYIFSYIWWPINHNALVFDSQNLNMFGVGTVSGASFIKCCVETLQTILPQMCVRVIQSTNVRAHTKKRAYACLEHDKDHCYKYEDWRRFERTLKQ